MRKSIIEVTLLLIISILAWLFNRHADLFFLTIGLCLLFAAGMAIYLLVRWRRLPRSDRLHGVIAMGGWLVMAVSVIHINGLSISCLFYP